MLAEILLLSFVMARSRAIRWHDLVALTAILCLADFLFLVGPSRWIWPDYGFSTLSTLRSMGRPTVMAAECGQVVLAMLLLAGLDPQLGRKIRAFVTPGGRGLVLRAAGAIVLLACALWSGRHLINDGTLAEVKVSYILTGVDLPNCGGSERSTAPNTPASPALAGCLGPANQYPTAVQPGDDTGKN